VTLADTSRGMREVAQAKIDAGSLEDARVWALDLATERPPDEQFDLIVTVLTLHHIVDLDTVVDGFARLLRPGGHLCVVDLEHEDGSFHGEGFAGHHGFERPALAARLTRHGFGDVSFRACHHIVRDGVTYPLFLATARREADQRRVPG
jgi:ubiquinone/menaquinone biosynthesis C-methylase UbiE